MPVNLDRLDRIRKAGLGDRMADLVDLAGWEDVATKIRWCGRLFHHHRCLNVSCNHEWDTRDTCHHRLCPYCAASRSALMYNEYKGLAQRVGAKHLVLTLKNVVGLGLERRANGRVMTAIDWIRSCFNRLRNRRLFKTAWKGGVYSIEFTWSPEANWHVHIHVFLNGQYVPQAEISKVWKQITGDSDVVWITARGSMREVLKYVLKPANFTERMSGASDEDVAAALDDFLGVIGGKHLIAPWGDAWGLSFRELSGFGDRATRQCPECDSYEVAVTGPFIESLPPRAPPVALVLV